MPLTTYIARLQKRILFKQLLFVSIIVISILFRFSYLARIPPSLSWDEVSFGYNAWSVLQTGRDEYGTVYPLLFRAFDEYKQPGLVYTIVLSEAVFGLTEFAVRFPTAFAGVVTVVYLFLIAKYLRGDWYAYIVSFLAAINPWLINFSRQAFESNVSLALVAMGIYYLLLSKQKQFYLYLSSLLLSSSLYYYHAARIVLPFILICYGIVYRKRLIKIKNAVLVSIVLGIVILLPLIPAASSQKGLSRINQVFVTDDPLYIARQRVYSNFILKNDNAWWTRIVYNRRRALIETIAVNYYKNSTFSHLFKTGTVSTGLFYLWELPFYVIGFVILLTVKKKWKWILITWFICYPLAGALTKDQPNSLRTLIGAPVIVLINGLGIIEVYNKIASKQLKKIFATALSIIVVVSMVQFSTAYFYEAPRKRALDFGDGHKQLAQFLATNQSKFDRIWVTGDYWRPYIHLLFHLKNNPAEYQKSGNPDGFGKYRFGKADWDTRGIDLKIPLNELVTYSDGSVLFILSSEEYHYHQSKGQQFSSVDIINGLYADNVFYAVTI